MDTEAGLEIGVLASEILVGAFGPGQGEYQRGIEDSRRTETRAALVPQAARRKDGWVIDVAKLQGAVEIGDADRGHENVLPALQASTVKFTHENDVIRFLAIQPLDPAGERDRRPIASSTQEGG